MQPQREFGVGAPSRNVVSSTYLHCHSGSAKGSPSAMEKRARLCNLHDVATAVGMIYFTYAYTAMIDYARQGLWGWIMGL